MTGVVEMIKLLIYDLDGTLIDSRWDIANAVNWTLKEMGFRELSLERISSFVGSGVHHLMRSVLNESLGEREVSEKDARANKFLERSIKLYRSRYAEHLLDETKLYPSVRVVLEHFKDRCQAVITNKPETFSHEILRGLGIDSYFFRVIGGDQAFAKKPSPESVLDIVKSAQVSSDETVLIGDSTIDIETGRNAGIKTIAVTYGFSGRRQVESSRPDFILSDLSELVECPFFR